MILVLFQFPWLRLYRYYLIKLIMTEFSTSENNIPAFLIPTKDLDIKLLSIWLFWITACTHVKGEREGFEGLQTVRLRYLNPLLLPLFSCCLISFYFSRFPPFFERPPSNLSSPIFRIPFFCQKALCVTWSRDQLSVNTKSVHFW